MRCRSKYLYSIVVTFFMTNDVLWCRHDCAACIRRLYTSIADTGNGPCRQYAANHPITIRGGVIFQKIYLTISLADDGIIVPLHPTLYSLLQREDTKVGGSRQGRWCNIAVCREPDGGSRSRPDRGCHVACGRKLTRRGRGKSAMTAPHGALSVRAAQRERRNMLDAKLKKYIAALLSRKSG